MTKHEKVQESMRQYGKVWKSIRNYNKVQVCKKYV